MLIYMIVILILLLIILFMILKKKKTNSISILLIVVIVITSYISYRFLPISRSKYENIYIDLDFNECKEELSSIDEESWCSFSYIEKIDVANLMVQINSTYLGLSDIGLEVKPYLENSIGRYDEKSKTVIVSKSKIENDSLEEVIITISHLMYHAYEYEVVNIYENEKENYDYLLLFREAKAFSTLNGFFECSNDRNSLYSDYSCEKLARSYSDFMYDLIM